jgi:putative copper export protein
LSGPSLPDPSFNPSGAALLADDGQADDASTGAPNWFRWLLRYLSYLAIFIVVGITATSVGVWKPALAHPKLRRAAIIATVAIVVLAVLHVAVLMNDIGATTWSSSLRQVPSFDVGLGLIARIALALLFGLVLLAPRRNTTLPLAAIVSGALLVTWSVTGHAKSQRKPWIGVPIDALHHASGAAWLGALIIVGFVARRAVRDSTYGKLQRRMSTFAFGSVVVLSVTGVAQSVRLVGLSWRDIPSTHTTLLAVKILVVAGMILLGNQNRLRLNRSSDATAAPDLRRSLLTEFGLGLIVLAITSSLVVASPSISNTSPDSSPDASANPSLSTSQTTTPTGETP